MKIAEALLSLGQLEDLSLRMDPNQLGWSALDCPMPAEALAAARGVYFDSDVWNWAPMRVKLLVMEWKPDRRYSFGGNVFVAGEDILYVRERAREELVRARARTSQMEQQAKETAANIVRQARREAEEIRVAAAAKESAHETTSAAAAKTENAEDEEQKLDGSARDFWLRACHACGKRQGKLGRCAGCVAVFCCSPARQQADWTAHKTACKAPRARAPAPAAATDDVSGTLGVPVQVSVMYDLKKSHQPTEPSHRAASDVGAAERRDMRPRSHHSAGDRDARGAQGPRT
mmetsp:Transcript_72798/g.109821  ORF Transcript_72798/g.109821 Transcript_72798/m.109821 type:complete len:289 (+) Transcript_72798:423-1289(+)